MASIVYDEIFSSFYMSIEDYDLMSLVESDAYLKMSYYLQRTLSRPHIRRLFSSIVRYDEIQVLEYELVSATEDEKGDEDFIITLLANGMAYEWSSSKVKSMKNISMFIGTSDEKFYSQAPHLSQLRLLSEDMYAEVQRMISDRGFSDNDYLNGTSIAATQRQVSS